MHAALYYTIESLGLDPSTHSAVFVTIHKEGNFLQNPKAIEAFLEKYLNNPSPTGFESGGQKLWLDYISPYIDEHFVDTYGTSKVDLTDGEIAYTIKNMPCFNLKPSSIISRLKLKNPIYSETAAYGHMGRESEIKKVSFNIAGTDKEFEVETFTWEKLDCQEETKNAFNL